MVIPRLARAHRFHSLRLPVATWMAVGAFVIPAAVRADAPTCSKDSDCSKGFTCQVSGISACPGSPACAPGEVCSTPAQTCTPQTTSSCQPGPCTTDSDCATGMVCYADTYQTCSGSGGAALCAKGDECPPPPAPTPPTCTTTTGPSSCVPKYELPCTVDSDCGDHFTCVPDTVSVCSGGGSAGSAGGVTAVGGGSGTGSSSSGESTTVAVPPAAPSLPDIPADAAAPPPIAEDAGVSCTTTTSSTSSCQADTIVCTADSDCPATWTCESQSVPVSNIACAEPVMLVDGSPVILPCIVDAGPTPASPQVCVPPYSTGVNAALSGVESAPGAVSEAPSGAGAGSSNNAGVAPTVANAATAGSSDKSQDGTGGGGCQMGASPAGAPSGVWLGLIACLGFAFRRRTRQSA